MRSMDGQELIQSYYSGVLLRLRSEIDLLNAIIPHNATKGAENEESLRNVIRSFVPQRYSVGSGIVIDSFGQRSRQIDIVIYDSQTYPALFSSTSTVLFPVETVIAAIEVKTFLDATKLRNVVENCRSIRALRHYDERIIQNTASASYPINIIEYETIPPSTHLVAFRVDSTNFCTWRSRYQEADITDGLPDTSLLLDISSTFSFRNSNERTLTDLECGFFALRAQDAGVEGPRASFIDHEAPNKTLLIGNRQYHSATFQKDGRYPVLMPERAFLSFLLRLNKALEIWPKHTSFDPSRYLDNDFTCFHSV